MRVNLKAAAVTAIITILAHAILFAETLLDVNFDNHPVGPYTKNMAKADFPGASWYNGMDEGWGEIVPGRDGMGNALRMKYPAGEFGPNNSAIQIKAVLGKGVDTAWASYRVKFEDGFDFVKGGKLPGLCGGECITGGNNANGYNGWSARLMWRREGVAVQYMYYVTNEGYGEDLLFDRSPPAKRFVPGQWHRVTTQIVMNTPGVADGVIRSWFDGELSMERENILIRHIDTLKIDQFYISTFFGGSDATWAPGADMYITYDDFLVVTHMEPWDDVTSAKPQTARAAKKFPLVKARKNGLIITASSWTTAPAQIEIFNAKGAFVRRVLTDGKADLFVPVKLKGLYLYRIKAGGDVVSGAVVVRF